MKLTKIQIEVLTLLEQGALMVVDKMNFTEIGERSIQFQTRTFLTTHRLVTRLDKTKAADVLGNGFVISGRGKQLLATALIGKR